MSCYVLKKITCIGKYYSIKIRFHTLINRRVE